MLISTEAPETPTVEVIALETRELTKSFGDRTVVDNLSIRVPQAKIAAFVGPNGAGKTTTLRMLLGLVYPSSGTATILDGTIEDPQSYLPRVGALIEGPAFYPALSGRANLEVLSSLGSLNRGRIPELLELVGLSERAGDKVGTYSLGMKQRLGLAAALLPDPSLLIVDEPGNGLDPTGIASLRALLRRIADQGITVLVSSHQLSELQQVADWVILIHQGRLKYQGTLGALLEGDRGGLMVKPENPGDAQKLAGLLKAAGFDVQEAEGGRISVELGTKSASDVNRLAFESGIMLSELQMGNSTLEHVYFSLTHGESSIA